MIFGLSVKAKEFFAVIVGAISLILFSNAVSGEVIKIGLRAHQGAEIAIKRWQPTVDYLNKEIPSYTFVLVPFEINSLLNQAVSRSEFEFVLTNPASYVEHKMRYGASAIATLINKRQGKAYSQFGSVVLTRADRNDITSFHDLKGKRFMAVDEQGFGGWRMIYRELLDKGVDPYKDFRLLSFGGGIQQNVVFAVRDGQVDAGSVRTDMLERMSQRGDIQLETFKVLEPKKTNGFEFYHSSRLYPEWPFAKLRHTSDDLANQVATALYKLTPESQAAKLGRYMGWATPLDYEPVNELLKELSVGPYAETGGSTLAKFIKDYWKEGLIALIVLSIALIISAWVTLSNRRLKRITSELERYQRNLEEMVSKRTAALHKTTVRLQTLFDTAAEFIFVIDPEDRIRQANRYVFERTGYKKDDVIGHRIKEFLTKHSQGFCECDFPILQERGHCRSDVEFVCNDGSILQMECSATAIPDENGEINSFIIIQHDVTERKLAEEAHKSHQQEMAHVARLGTMGEMATGIAHELNQPLTALISYCGTAASLVNSQPSQPQQLSEILEMAKEQAHRAGDIIRNLREFVSKERKNKETFELDRIIYDIVTFLKGEIQKSDVKIELHLGGQECKVKANKIQIEQVLVNLMQNSLEALEHAGIAAGRVVIQSRLLENNVIEVSVCDNGPGIDAAMANRIFDQFQTSKVNGMGIGLSLSRSIIEAHGGKLWVDKEHQNGALFAFELPVSD
jgi:two-component system sensor histidine kinase TtrS